MIRQPEEKFQCDMDYIESDDSVLMLVPQSLANRLSDLNAFVYLLHTPFHAKSTMKVMAKKIDDAICDYLA